MEGLELRLLTKPMLAALTIAGLTAGLPFATTTLAQGTTATAEAAPKTIFDGVYTEEQADRGKKVYLQYCADCHGSQGGGSGAAPPLTGSTIDNYDGGSVADIVNFMISAMPPDNPGYLRTREYADIMSYILKLHGAPAGDTELPGKIKDLETVEIIAKPE